MSIFRKLKKFLTSPYHRFIVLGLCGFYDAMSDEDYIKRAFRYSIGYDPDIDHPKTFNEKMQWLKLHNRDVSCINLVDKYEAKRIVGKIIGDKYIIPAFGVWDKFSDIDFSKLATPFILKCTHDSGGYAVCRNKKFLTLLKARIKINLRMKMNYYRLGREWVYNNITPRVFAEAFLENEQDKGLHDYKVWSFNGHAEYIQYISGRHEQETYGGFYDREWNLQPFMYDHPLPKEPVPKPERLEELISCAEKLAHGIPFVRVDFYVLEDGSIKFGEMTFYPCAGFHKWITESADLEMGKKINLDGIERISHD